MAVIKETRLNFDGLVGKRATMFSVPVLCDYKPVWQDQMLEHICVVFETEQLQKDYNSGQYSLGHDFNDCLVMKRRTDGDPAVLNEFEVVSMDTREEDENLILYIRRSCIYCSK